MKFEGLILDGGMGSLLLERSGIFAPSERFTITHPDLILNIHRDYLAAGTNVLCTNTFGVNPFKVGEQTSELIKKGLDLALQAKRESQKEAYVALDVGPLGKIMGKGGISFDQAYQAFAQVIRAGEDRADYIVLETFTDLAELRAAILAAKENSRLPVAASMSFESGGRTAFGVSVECFAIAAQALGADVLGLNCSVGPVEMQALFRRLQQNTSLPTFVKPNAGLPSIIGGKSVYNMKADAFARAMVYLKEAGASMLGGCCGTTPEYIRATVNAIAKVKGNNARGSNKGKLCSASSFIIPQKGAIIGERINPTGKKALQQALREGNLDYVVALGPKQEDEGAKMLDVNLGMSGFDDGSLIVPVLEGLQAVTNLPLAVDSGTPATIEKALRVYHGKALVNSVTGEDASLRSILPIVAKYGAAVVGLTLDANGVPGSAKERVEIAKKIVKAATSYGIAPEDIYIDCLTMSEGAQKGSARTTLEALQEVKKLGCRTVLGVSNVSYGLPAREDLNAAFLSLAVENGLDAAIFNPKYAAFTPSEQAKDFLLGKIPFEAYNDFVSSHAVSEVVEEQACITTAVKRGDVAGVRAILSAAQTKGEDLSAELFASLDMIGALYEQGKIFLPQLIAAADAAKAGLDMLFSASGEKRADKGTFLLATVKGDVHDIGKNIVKAVVQNYGYKVVDLGKDVRAESILEALSRHYPCALGLSALMTTTAVNMADIIQEVRKKYPNLPILTGGAVITEEYARSIGGIYCKDAAAAVRELNKIFLKK